MCCGRTKDLTPAPRARQTPVSSFQAIRPGTRGIPALYVGATAMTVVGPVSGTIYRFEAPGARVELDQRDASRLEGVPKLKFVR